MMPEIIGTLVGLAFVALLFGWMWADDNSWFGWFDRMSISDDRLAMRALAQHSKLMKGEPGAEYGNYQPIDLDSDDVLKFATVTLPNELDIESHWGTELLRRAPIVDKLRENAYHYARLAKLFPDSDSRHELRSAFLSLYADSVDRDGTAEAISRAETDVKMASAVMDEKPYYLDQENHCNARALKASADAALVILRGAPC
ncbi:hypothetical protein PROPHIGD86-1_148 [Mycobacterium phage prophi86-1]|nr:hypothetical protein PROPHIGD86-1_148 [Mycobacterium phage prophi86-1]SIC59222.1 Uncharacterised protein [Mycobacteroides abscessus subsp. abscessus]